MGTMENGKENQRNSGMKQSKWNKGRAKKFARKKLSVKLPTYLQIIPGSRIRGSIHPLPDTSSWRSAQLIKHRDNFTFFKKEREILIYANIITAS
jgi:hypothetical protein